MRRGVAAGITAALVLGGAASGAALAVSSRSTHVQTPAPVVRADHFWSDGPSATYDGDYGAIGAVRPVEVAVPDGGADAVVEVTFTYRTTGTARFVAGLSVSPRGSTHYLATKPGTWRLEAGAGRTTTLRYLVRGLTGATTYSFAPNVNAYVNGHAGIASSHVVMTVDLTTAS